jgi:segregation and condensation protein B
MEEREIQHFVEAALLAAGRPLSIDQIQGLFDGRSAPEKAELRKAIEGLNEQYEERGIEIREVASGFRMQVKSSMADRLQKLWEERPPRYSRALFETLALIAYRQPITRGEIEEIRGVTVSSNIVRTLMERDWVRVVGHRDVPGRPAMFGTTKGFLDYFNLKKLDDLPALADLADWESLRIQLDLPDVDGTDADEDGDAGEADGAQATEEEGHTGDTGHAADENSEEQGGEDEGGVPVLYPETEIATGEAPSPEAEEDRTETEDAGVTGEDAPATEDLPELVPEEDGDPDEELVVSEWPDPAKSSRG